MTEQEIISCGFKKIDVPVEESGDKNNYYYYMYQLSDTITLTSNASDEVLNNNWYIVGDLGDCVTITELSDLLLLTSLFAKWMVSN